MEESDIMFGEMVFNVIRTVGETHPSGLSRGGPGRVRRGPGQQRGPLYWAPVDNADTHSMTQWARRMLQQKGSE